MIFEVCLKRFKRFRNQKFTIKENGLSICAGPNSSGKSTLLQALAVWSFGTMVVREFKGMGGLTSMSAGQGLSKDDFTPVNVPDLKHLWFDLKSQIPGLAEKGYSMSIKVKWRCEEHEKSLEMSFSLVQDRLYVKATETNLNENDKIPQIVYLPPVAGVDAREEFATPAKRRTMLGRGLAGSVLRNYLMDLEIRNKQTRELAKVGKQKITSKDLKEIRETDPWERLNASMRETFGLELSVEPFNADFHSVVKVYVTPKRKDGKNKKWVKSGVKRDLMVEGAGAQQWLTVFAFALAPETDVLLLDEPDAHLFTRLKVEMVEQLSDIAERKPQILLATHATEILKRHPLDRIMSFGEENPRYLNVEKQRTQLICGLGDDYAPLIERARISRKILFVENESDARILEALAGSLELKWPESLAIHVTTESHPDRRKFYGKLSEAIDGLKGISIRDRDTGPIGGICPDTLEEKGIKAGHFPGFQALTWRRREIENYALIPDALVKEFGEKKVKAFFEKRGWAWPWNDVEEVFFDVDLKACGSDLFGNESKVKRFLSKMPREHIHPDLTTVIGKICS